MLEKKYDSKLVEKDKYNKWMENGYFSSGDLTLKPYCIVIPPPNVTGKLHLGHAWDTTIQDILIRYKRMCGYDALWLPGTDHAGIATQAKVDDKLSKMGINPRDLSREEWLSYAWSWKEEYAGVIREQWAKLGLSLDYDKERFTMDDGLSYAVKKAFITLYNKGYIYRGKRMINFDPKAMTALSNIEVIYKEVEDYLYNLKYYIEGTDEYLEVATTRPETIYGDVAICVNENDDRYKHLIGKSVIVPLVNSVVPIIADDEVDIEFGTGVLKITPAHSMVDYEIGKRHNLEIKNTMNKNGTMNDLATPYNGLDRFEARAKIIDDLETMGLIASKQKYVHQVGFSERTNVVVEPFISLQWFVKMDELAKNMLEVQRDDNRKTNFYPESFNKILINWMENIEDWCISRQLWWGHQIPAWYKGDEVYVGYESPGEGFIQDDDVLDTWFSSALWPFSTLGWPNGDINRYFPNDCLVTGYDIIPFWVSRMMFQSVEFTNQMPFKDIIIHGLVRDKDGRKMSKSLGNGVDPMDVIEKYGADSLRTFLATTATLGQDLRYDEDKVYSMGNFINKLWNASRYLLLNINNFSSRSYDFSDLNYQDKWILTYLNKTIKDVRKYLDKYDFNLAFSSIYNFVWDKYCSFYIETSKFNINRDVLLYTLESIVKLLHPFMPFVTEEIYQKLPIKEATIMKSAYPEYNENHIFEEETSKIDISIDLVSSYRNKIQELKITTPISYELDINDKEITNLLLKLLKIDKDLLKKSDSNSITIKEKDYSIICFYEEQFEDINILIKEKEQLENSISKRKALLENENYINKAPKNIVDMDKEKLTIEIEKLEILKQKINK